MTLRALKYGNSGIFLISGNAGSISSTDARFFGVQEIPKTYEDPRSSFKPEVQQALSEHPDGRAGSS